MARKKPTPSSSHDLFKQFNQLPANEKAAFRKRFLSDVSLTPAELIGAIRQMKPWDCLVAAEQIWRVFEANGFKGRGDAAALFGSVVASHFEHSPGSAWNILRALAKASPKLGERIREYKRDIADRENRLRAHHPKHELKRNLEMLKLQKRGWTRAQLCKKYVLVVGTLKKALQGARAWAKENPAEWAKYEAS